jgi:predicted transcriptional regulator
MVGLETLVWLVWATGLGAFGSIRIAHLRRERVAEHPTRRALLDHLRKHPGTTISELCRAVGAKWGTVQHHLFMLQRAGRVSSVAEGRERNFFPASFTDEEAKKVSILKRGRTMELVRAIVERPGIIQRDLTEGVVMRRKVLRKYVDLLKEENLLEEVPVSRTRQYFPTPELAAVLENPNLDLSVGHESRPEGPSGPPVLPERPGF